MTLDRFTMDQQRQLEGWLKDRLEAHVLTYPHRDEWRTPPHLLRGAETISGGDFPAVKPEVPTTQPSTLETDTTERSSLQWELGALLAELDSLVKRATTFKDTLQSFYSSVVAGDNGRIVVKSSDYVNTEVV